MPQTTSSLSGGQSGPGGGSLQPQIHELPAWVETLPLADVNETYHRVLKVLLKINDGGLSYQEHFQALESLRSPVQYLSDALRYQLMGSCLPLTIKTRGIATQLFKLHSEMTGGYQHISEELFDLDAMHQDFTTLATSLHRSLHYLSQGLLTDYQIYESNSGDYWRRIHQIYEAAERKGLQSSSIKDPYRRDRQETTVEEQYKQILLLALANPYRHSQPDLAWIYTQLHHWAPLCQLRPADHLDASRHACLVDLANDAPPSYDAYNAIHSPTTCRQFETSALVDALLNSLSRRAGQSTTQEDAAAPRQMTANRTSLLHALVTAWSLAAKRRFSRMRSGATGISVRLGLSAIHQFIDARNALHTDDTNKASDGDANAGNDTYVCKVVNESADGVCLKWQSTNTGKIRVGELITVGRNDESGDMPGIGVIRWLKTAGKHTVNFGIQLLSPDAFPITIRVYNSKNQLDEHDYLKGLYIPEFRTARQPPSLILPAFLYHSDDIVSVIMDGQEHGLQLTKLVDATQGFSRFRFEPIAAPDSSGSH